MEEKGLTAHKAEGGTEDIEADNEIADGFHDPCGRPRELLAGKFLHKFHNHHLMIMIAQKFMFVKNKIMFIVKFLMIDRAVFLCYTFDKILKL